MGRYSYVNEIAQKVNDLTALIGEYHTLIGDLKVDDLTQENGDLKSWVTDFNNLKANEILQNLS